MSNIILRSELDYLYYGASLCEGRKYDRDGNWQVAPFFGSIPYGTMGGAALREFEARLWQKFEPLAAYGKNRARKAFVDGKDTATKPSYTKRLNSFVDGDINQVDEIVRLAAKEPSSGGLVFSVFHPRDLKDRNRPGYVPCLVSGTLLLVDGELQLNAFFRSQSILEFGLYDLLFLREFQTQVLEKLKARCAKYEPVVPGQLNIFAARVFVKRRLCRTGNTNYLYRSDLYAPWLQEISEVKRAFNLQ